jgi:integrase/recombinase XerD
MEKKIFTESQLYKFKQFLVSEERAAATIEKYLRDVRIFLARLPDKTEVTKENILEYKKALAEKYRTSSANSMLVALNRFLGFCSREDLKVKLFKVQRVSFRDQKRELNEVEYRRLIRFAEAKKNERLSLMLQTIGSTGIRVSEHRFITVESLRTGEIRISNKGKERVIFLTEELKKRLKKYCKERRITTGPVFITQKGNPVNRCNLWTQMKALCKDAGVAPHKVFPHNLRHLFALSYYRIEKDIVRLADILGHTSIETTRIYTSTTTEECLRTLSRLNLLI